MSFRFLKMCCCVFSATEMNGSSQVSGSEPASQADSIFVEGLVPGIDFCNHGNLTILIKCSMFLICSLLIWCILL